jgi:hypothetical protein
MDWISSNRTALGKHFEGQSTRPERKRRAMKPRLWVAAVLGTTTLWAGAASAQLPSRDLASYVLLGLDKIQMKEFSFTKLGNVGVNNEGGTLYWGNSSFFDDGTDVVADSLNRAGQNSSLFCLYANETHSPLSNITIRSCGGQPVPWAPQPLIDPLPPDPSCSPGASAVKVARGGSQTLPAGSYGKVRVLNGATLELTGGSYCFDDVKLGRKAKIVADAPVDITSMHRYVSGPGSRLVAATGSGLGATNIMVGVAGRLVKLSHKNKIFGIFYAPKATMRFGRGGNFTGQFVARKMRSDFGDTFTHEVCGNGVVDPGEACDDGPENGQPGSCCTAECGFEPVGTPCPDGNLCNGTETCSAFGQCVPGSPPDCNDHNPCTADSCVPATGCHAENKQDGTPCSDGMFCNGAEVCEGGTCTDQSDPDCDDGNPCTNDSCDPAANSCVNPPIPDCIPCPNGDSDCDNHNACDGDETCDPFGKCQSGTPLVCTTSNQCLDPICDPQTGCGTEPKAEGTPCDDDDACSENDQCTGGVCGGMVNGCDDGDPCTQDTCDSQTGCENTPIPGCPSNEGRGPFCSLTPGAYGAPGGIANGGQGWITNNPGVLPASIGAPGTGRSVTVNTQAGLIAFLPAQGTAAALNPAYGDVVIDDAGDVPDPNASGSGGAGAGVLAGHTLSLRLSVKLSNIGVNPTGFGNYVLESSFCTCDGIGGHFGPFTISQCILDNAQNVNDLIDLANLALRGANLASIDACLTYSDINAALTALNNGFDTCRTVCACAP